MGYIFVRFAAPAGSVTLWAERMQADKFGGMRENLCAEASADCALIFLLPAVSYGIDAIEVKVGETDLDTTCLGAAVYEGNRNVAAVQRSSIIRLPTIFGKYKNNYGLRIQLNPCL